MCRKQNNCLFQSGFFMWSNVFPLFTFIPWVCFISLTFCTKVAIFKRLSSHHITITHRCIMCKWRTSTSYLEHWEKKQFLSMTHTQPHAPGEETSSEYSTYCRLWLEPISANVISSTHAISLRDWILMPAVFQCGSTIWHGASPDAYQCLDSLRSRSPCYQQHIRDVDGV